MRNKGAILTFTALLTLACLYQLSFTWVGSIVQSNAKEYATGDIQKEQHYLDSMDNVDVYPILGFTYDEVKKKQLNLGLDLKGGMNVVLEVSVESVLEKVAANPEGEMFKRTLAEAKKKSKNTSEDFVSLFVDAFQNLYPNKKLVSLFYSLENKGSLSRDDNNDKVAKFLRKQTDDAISGAFQVIRTRVRLFGVAQPNIQRLKSTDRIMVELPGVKNQKRVRTLLQGTAKLEFWETYENKEVFKYISEANDRLSQILRSGGESNDSLSSDSSNVLSSDSSNIANNASKDSLNDNKSDSNDVISELLGGGNKESTSGDSSLGDDGLSDQEEFDKKNPLYALMRPNVVQENDQLMPAEGPVVGYCAINDTARINKYLAMPKIKQLFPLNLKLMWTAKPYDKEKKYLRLIAIKVTNSEGKAPLEGDVISDASQQFSQRSGSPEIQMKMNSAGAKAWKRITGDNIGRSVAISLDGKIYSFPTVQSEISGGVSQITGNFTIDEAKLIANILKSGKLPAPTHIVQETVVGPSLGRTSITNGLFSFIIALLVVWMYVFFFYSTAGLVADIALIANIFFIFGVLTSTSIALTLPGIAGIVLTLGMAVDANVLIYERIKEELRAGKTKRLAIADGFKMAYPAIIDGNVTTLLTGIILWTFGTGPIKGFAQTLSIGILTSLFSAIFITRLIVSWRIDKNKPIQFYNKWTEKIMQNTSFKFMKNRKYAYAFSILVIIIGIISMSTRGFSYGVDFSGGRTFLVSFDKNVTTDQVRKDVASQFIDVNGNKLAPEVKTFGSSNQVEITTNYMINNDEQGTDQFVEEKLNAGLSQIGDKYEILESHKVGPTVASDIKNAAYLAVILAMIAMFIYIMARFRGWQYGLGGILALIHDSLFLLTIFSLLWGVLPFSLDIDQSFIAAILTVIGYSINDSVIVFDRIREYLGFKTKKKDSLQLVDEAINSTLSRTVNTALTTIFTLLMIFIFGGAVIRGFVFALLIGIIVGTYSSIFISAPLMLDLSGSKLVNSKEKREDRRKKSKAQTA